MLKRYLEMVSPTPDDYDAIAFQDLIRAGNEQGLLLGDWPRWKKYRDMRSKTSHTYDEDVALEVVAEIAAFQDEARYLCDRLQTRLA
jgi:nucleotidyltransferase substrate binding protein (TIGR01987 family)